MEVLDLPDYDPGSLDYMLQFIPQNEFFEGFEDQDVIVKQVVAEGQCNSEIINGLRPRLYQTNNDKLGRLLEDRRYDHMVQNSTTCLLEAVFADYEHKRNPALNNILTQARYLTYGGSSAVYNVDIDNHLVLAMKTVDNDNLTYEAFVGYAINSLRSKIPNFMHTYGMITCPYSEDNVKVCRDINTEKEDKLIIENIMGQEIKPQVSNLDMVNVLLQIVNALNVANKAIGFVHYDLHPGNIIIVPLCEPMSIPLYLPNGDIKYIITNFLVRIIDFGLSRVELNHTVFHIFGLEYIGITRDNKQYYDLLRFCLAYNRISKNPVITQVLTNVYGLESDDDRRWQDIVSDSSYMYLTLDDILEYLLTTFSECKELVFDNPRDDSIIGICSDCYSWKNYTATIFDSEKLPTTVIEFMAAYNAALNLERPTITDFILTAPVQTIYETERSKIFGIKPLIFKSVNEFHNFIADDEDIEDSNEFYNTWEALNHVIDWIQASRSLFEELPQYFPSQEYIDDNLEMLDTQLEELSPYSDLALEINRYINNEE